MLNLFKETEKTDIFINEGTRVNADLAVSQLRDTLKSRYHRYFPGKSDKDYYQWFDEIEGPRIHHLIDPIVYWVSSISSYTTSHTKSACRQSQHLLTLVFATLVSLPLIITHSLSCASGSHTSSDIILTSSIQ